MSTSSRDSLDLVILKGSSQEAPKDREEAEEVI